MSGPTIDRANSSGDIWTPWSFIRAVENRFGIISWDLAASLESSRAHYTGLFISELSNSLSISWSALGPIVQDQPCLLWLNPPFSNITPWARKCYEEWQHDAEILLLVPMGGQNWYWDHVEPFAQVYSVGRMVFDNCFDKQGKLVTTAYPKDLILAHYKPYHQFPNRPQRWRWKEKQ